MRLVTQTLISRRTQTYYAILPCATATLRYNNNATSTTVLHDARQYYAIGCSLKMTLTFKTMADSARELGAQRGCDPLARTKWGERLSLAGCKNRISQLRPVEMLDVRLRAYSDYI